MLVRECGKWGYMQTPSRPPGRTAACSRDLTETSQTTLRVGPHEASEQQDSTPPTREVRFWCGGFLLHCGLWIVGCLGGSSSGKSGVWSGGRIDLESKSGSGSGEHEYAPSSFAFGFGALCSQLGLGWRYALPGE